MGENGAIMLECTFGPFSLPIGLLPLRNTFGGSVASPTMVFHVKETGKQLIREANWYVKDGGEIFYPILQFSYGM